MGVKLGQKWAVKDGNLLASNRVGSRFFNKEFDFSRASNGTYVDRDGLLKTAELYNLVSYSEDLVGYWSGSGSGIVLDDNVISANKTNNVKKITASSSGNFKGLVKNLGTSFASKTLTISAFVKKSTTDWMYFYNIGATGGNNGVWFNIDNGSIGTINNAWSNVQIEDYGGGWYRCSATLTYGAADLDYVYILMSDEDNNVIAEENDSIYIWGTQLVEGTEPLDYQYTNGLQGLPRISFEDGVGHLLLEPQRSNLVTYSNSYNFWTKDDITLTSGQSGVYGTNNAWLIQGNTNSSRHNINRPLSAVTGQHCFSLYAKAKELQYIQIASAQTTEEYANFDLSDGSVGNVGSRFLDAKATSVGNGWYRLSIYTNNGFNSFYISLIQSKTDAWLPIYSGANSTDGLYIQHAQLEAGSYPTSIIETTTTSVTRLADVCNNSGSEQDFNSEEGVLYAEILKRQDNNDNYVLMSINDGGGNDQNTVTIGFDNEDDFYARIKSSGTTNLLYTSVTANKDQFYKIALRYKSGENAVYIDGVEVFTTSSTINFANPLSRLDFDYISITSLPFYGKVRNLQVFTEALSDAELQQLTS